MMIDRRALVIKTLAQITNSCFNSIPLIRYTCNHIGRGIVGLLCMLVSILPTWAQSASDREPTLTIFSSTDTKAMQPLLDAFQAQHPTIAIDYHELQTTDIYQRVKTYAPLDHTDPTLDLASPKPDLVISSAMDLQTKLINDGYGRQFKTPNTERVPEWARWRDEIYGFTYEPAAMVYNKLYFSSDTIPRTREALSEMIRAEPELFKGRIGTYDIRQSGVGYLFASQDIIYDYQYSRLLENFGRSIIKSYCCTHLMLEGVRTGELILAYNVIGSYALDAAKKDNNIGIALMDDYSLVMTRTVFIPHFAPHPDEAEKFVDFLVSDDGQSTMADTSSLIPIMAHHPTNASDAPAAAFTHSRYDQETPMIPIRLNTRLLTYLDPMKKESFLNDWTSAMGDPESHDE